MIQFVTVFIRLYAAAYKVIFLIISCGLQSRVAYNEGRLTFFISWLYRKVQMTLIFSWVRLFDQLFFRIPFSSASRAHPSQKELCLTEGSCSGV